MNINPTCTTFLMFSHTSLSVSLILSQPACQLSFSAVKNSTIDSKPLLMFSTNCSNPAFILVIVSFMVSIPAVQFSLNEFQTLLIPSHKFIQNFRKPSHFFHKSINPATSAVIPAIISPMGFAAITAFNTPCAVAAAY